MFYIKEKTEGCTVKVDITDENVFTECPSCGKDIQIDLNEWIQMEDFDLFGLHVYCEECSNDVRMI